MDGVQQANHFAARWSIWQERHRYAPWAVYPPQFEVDEFILAEYVGYRERAGLFAWQETAADFLRWPEERRYELAERALASIELTHGTAQDCNEIALYDPEFEQ